MVLIIEVEKLTKVIRNIEARRATLSDRVEIWLTFSKFTSIYEAALCEEYELIEESNYVATRLMYRKDNGAIIVARK